MWVRMLEISWHLLLHLRFQAGHPVMSVLEAEGFVQLDVLLDMQLSVDVLNADVMHVQIIARGHGANAVEQAFLAAGAGYARSPLRPRPAAAR